MEDPSWLHGGWQYMPGVITWCHHPSSPPNPDPTFAPFPPASSPPLLQAKFIKLVRESELLVEGQLSATDCDIIFAKCKQRSARRISCEQVGRRVLWVGGWLGGAGRRVGAEGMLDAAAPHHPHSPACH